MAIHRSEVKITPSFVIGCGGRGTMAVHYAREYALQEIFKKVESQLKEFRPVRFCVIDSVVQALEDLGVMHHIKTISIGTDEIIKVIEDPNYPNTGNRVKAIMSLFPPDRDYKRILDNLRDVYQGNATCPALGRMSFLTSWERIYSNLKNEINTSWGNPFSAYNLPVGDIRSFNQIFIIAGLYGGTGSGAFIDLAAMLRLIFRELELPTPAIYGIFFLPDLTSKGNELLRANAFACLTELDYYASGNAYRLPLANGKTLMVKNTYNDCLFNKIFLINDRNRAGIEIDKKEAAKMVGRVVFHWAFTQTGNSINQRLQDMPNNRINTWAPEKEKFRQILERRKTAYSSFGFASAFIPYDQMRNNFIVKFAINTMNELLLLSNPNKPEKTEEMKNRRNRIFERKFAIHQILRDLNLTEEKLKYFLKLEPPVFDRFDSIAEYMEENGLDSLSSAFSAIQKEMKNFIEPENQDEFQKLRFQFENAFKEDLVKVKDRLIKMFGPALAQRGVREIKEKIQEMIAQKDLPDRGSESIQSSITGILRKGREIVDDFDHSFLIKKLFNQKDVSKKFDYEILNHLKRNTDNLLKLRFANIVGRVWTRSVEMIDDQLRDMEKEEERFIDILKRLRLKYCRYSEGKIQFNPIPVEILDDYLDRLYLPSSLTPQSLAENLRKNGLVIKTKKEEKSIPIHDFDDYPEPVCQALLEQAEQLIGKAAIQWNRSFSESGLFPLAESSDGDHKTWYLNCYDQTWKELTTRSLPYLEYQDGGGFDTFENAFIILPAAAKDELSKWRQHGIVCDMTHDLKGNAEVSPYHISILQFHHGLPIYSIDEIADWREALKKKLMNDRRPFLKSNLPMRNPYINITVPRPRLKKDVEELYDWAKHISENCLYPIFVILPGSPQYYFISDEEGVREFYFELFDEEYLSPEEITEIVAQDQDLMNYLVILLENLPAVIQKKALKIPKHFRKKISEFLTRTNLSQPEKLKLIGDILAILSQIKDLPEESGFKCNDAKLHILADRRRAGSAYYSIRTSFSEYRKVPRLKKGITRDEEIQELLVNPEFYREFLQKCDEARHHLPGLDPDLLPKLLQDNE